MGKNNLGVIKREHYAPPKERNVVHDVAIVVFLFALIGAMMGF